MIAKNDKSILWTHNHLTGTTVYNTSVDIGNMQRISDTMGRPTKTIEQEAKEQMDKRSQEIEKKEKS